MNESPFMILLYVGVAAYMGYLYLVDYRLQQSGGPDPKALPGATSAGNCLYVIAVVGALLLLAIETGGEIALGVSAEQSDMVWYFVFASVAAGIIEETVFRGFLVVDKKGRAVLIGSCVGFSLVFALIHGHFWSNEAGEAFTWTFTIKAFFTTAILFANSLWFYALRFGRWNKNRSLFPCMLAHAASNFGVFAVKLVQGHVIF